MTIIELAQDVPIFRQHEIFLKIGTRKIITVTVLLIKQFWCFNPQMYLNDGYFMATV